jgi:transposase-like protein
MGVFRWRHFAGEIILWAVRWYCRYGISYRELEEMMGERGVAVDHTTLYRWTQRYAPELEKRSAWYRSRLSFSWRITSVKMVEIAGGFEVAISHAACGGICIRALSVRGTISSAMPSICM